MVGDSDMKHVLNKSLCLIGISTMIIGIIYSYVGIITGILSKYSLTPLGLQLSFIDVIIFIIGFALIFISISNEKQVLN